VHASIPGIWHLGVLPATLAITLAALPIDAWILFAPPLLLLWLATSLPIRPRLPARALGTLVMVGTLWLCARLPVKHMDRVVGPAEYRGLTLQTLSSRLYEDHGIICDVTSADIENRIVDFTIPSPMSRRKVMHKLAHDTRLGLHIAGCGNGASLLWGTGPGIAYLFEPEFP